MAAQGGLRAKTIDEDAMKTMMHYHWPGNVRELENMIRRVLVLVDDDIIKPHHLKDLLQDKNNSGQEPGSIPINGDPSDLDHNGQNLTQAADLYISRFFASHQGELPASGLYHRILEQVEKPLIMATLRATAGNQIKAAEVLGLNRNTLRKKITSLGLDHDLKGILRR